MTKKMIKRYCYLKWLASPQHWNHYRASRLLEKQLFEKYNITH